MLARPFASDTVTARETCRLKCSVVTNVAAGPDAGARAAAGASGPKARVAMPRSVTLTARTGRDGGTPRRRSRGAREHEQARGSIVSDNDLRLARVVVPLERDRETSIVACVEFYKHASRGRLQPTARARVRPWVAHGIDRLCTPGGEFGTGGADRRMRLAAIANPGPRRDPPPGVAGRGSRLRRSGFVPLLAGALLRQRGRGHRRP